MLALANGEKIVRTDKLICEVLNSAPAPVLPKLLAARHQAGLAIFDATGRYRPSDEPYLNWPGKAQAWTQAISPTTARWEENLAQDGDHLYLEGDNLSVLKLLLPQLQGKVQVVYADPPYNTGKNFVYADNFVLSPSAYERRYGTAERCYGVAEPCSGAGRWHAQWCSFIYPRLLLARELMAENAVGNNRPRLKRFLSELKHEGMVPLSLILPENLQEASSPELGLATRLIHMANLDQAKHSATCLLLGDRERCAVMAQVLSSGQVATQYQPQILWPQRP